MFREFLSLENGLPSHDTFSRLFRLLDPDALSLYFSHFLDVLGAVGEGVVAIDGKTLRRSFDRATSASALYVVTAFASEAQLVLGQKAVLSGGNEITAARDLLRLLDLKGVLVTGDAIHCQRETAEIIREGGGDYLFALKANRPAMLADVTAYFADPPAEAVAIHETTDADHGRLEVRRHSVSHDVGWLFSDRRYPHEPAMPALASIAMVEARVERDGKTCTSQRYYLSSAKLPPDAFARAVRVHWGIENCLHWVLDVSFDEDRARNRKDHGKPRHPAQARPQRAPPSPTRHLHPAQTLTLRMVRRLRQIRHRPNAIALDPTHSLVDWLVRGADIRTLYHPKAQCLPLWNNMTRDLTRCRLDLQTNCGVCFSSISARAIMRY